MRSAARSRCSRWRSVSARRSRAITPKGPRGCRGSRWPGRRRASCSRGRYTRHVRWTRRDFRRRWRRSTSSRGGGISSTRSSPAHTVSCCSAALSLYLYVTYDREAALTETGFQFYERVALVPPLGINYELGVDGISLLMVLLTSIIIFAGVFASWTIATRSQEFYALLLALVTGVYGVFVSLDLFVFFLFYELAVLPMYLLIGIWGSSGEFRPRGIFAWAYR